MKIVMLSTTPLAGAPYETMKCLRKYAGLDVRWICWKDRYLDGRVFPSDVVWTSQVTEAKRLIRDADIVHLQNDMCVNMMADFPNKRILGQLHSVPMRSAFFDLQNKTKHVYTIDQPLQLKEYKVPALPNLMDPEEYQPIDESLRIRDTKTVLFAPTNKWPAARPGSKGENEVLSIIKKYTNAVVVEDGQPIRFRFDYYTNLPYRDNLARKRVADIIIDDVVNETFHKTTIEGCCFGAAVLTNYNTGGWVKTNLSTLEANLKLLLKDDAVLSEVRNRCREWAETTWHPRNQVQRYVDAYSKVLEN